MVSAEAVRCVIAVNPGHDGAVAVLADGILVASLEGEKDSHPRHGHVTGEVLMRALEYAPRAPDILAVGGWHRLVPSGSTNANASYTGLKPGTLESARVLGLPKFRYTSSHERSHIFAGVAMSPFDPCHDLAVLVWEGVIGSFYSWRDGGATLARHEVLSKPGDRYAALFAIADPNFPSTGAFLPPSLAGKLMALAGFADDLPVSLDTRQVVKALLTAEGLQPFDKRRYRRSPLYNGGIMAPEFCRAARLLSDELFSIFLRKAKQIVPPGLPLVISGGCGLNCDWNSAWDNCGWFSDVFVPPTANDSGSAVGTAVDAWAQAGHRPSIEWDVYRGAAFHKDANAQGWSCAPIDEFRISRALGDGEVVAWVQGRCEIGPRALGHRSLLASATMASSRHRLNAIKQREGYRPIAPVCLEEDLGEWFDDSKPDPHMLRFRRVRTPDRLPAIVHVDGTARVQSVTARSCSALHKLLTTHRTQTGVGVLCNTSLNYPGQGFLNRTSEVLAFCKARGIRHVVVDDLWLTRSE